MRKILLFYILLSYSHLKSQEYQQQYFDGADTSSFNSLFIDYGSDTINNIWQIGKPQKILFDSAATIPYAIITDTINYYPNSDTSSFQIHFEYEDFYFDWIGVFAFQWMQKLDYDTMYDGGKIEFSIDSGQTWNNAFENPLVYNMYGYEEANVDTLPNGEHVFTGTDSTWRNIWICFDYSYLYNLESLYFKFTSISDSINNNKEGWLIDNFIAHITYVHTLKTVQKEYVKIFPNPTTDRLYINLKRQKSYHIIEQMQVIDLHGKVIEEFKNIPTKFFINTINYPNGTYFLNIKTNLKSETRKFVVEH